MWAALPLLLAAAFPVQELDVYFEVKLLVRDHIWGRRVEVDQWSGGRVRMRGSPTADGATVYRLTRVLEDPWTFRWYPTRDEVKLGAAIHVERAVGQPYDALARQLEPLARAKYALWWDADEAVPGPEWSAESGRFWARRHATEQDEKDRLAADPTYPFHVLGPLAGRLGFTVRDGAVEQIVERMTRPWVENGWARSIAGEAIEGYGFWGRHRPRWEPRTYETFAAALLLLGPDPVDPETGLSQVLTAMQPRTRRLSRRGREDLRYRTWREADEIQLLVESADGETFKAWVRVGYRAVPPRTP